MTHPHLTHADQLEWTRVERGNSFQASRKQLGAAAGGRQLGCSLIRLEPGKRAWPFHYHAANEEAIYILEGTGTLRLGDKRVAVSRGDYIALPADPNLPHQLINTSEQVLEYLCMSTMIHPEVVGYPDSNKMGLGMGRAPGELSEKASKFCFFPTEAEVDYWQGEDETL